MAGLGARASGSIAATPSGIVAVLRGVAFPPKATMPCLLPRSPANPFLTDPAVSPPVFERGPKGNAAGHPIATVDAK